jgi:ribosome biogenesis protein Tsr3
MADNIPIVFGVSVVLLSVIALIAFLFVIPRREKRAETTETLKYRAKECEKDIKSLVLYRKNLEAEIRRREQKAERKKR